MSEPDAWMQIGVGPLHEGERIPRLTKPKEWNPEWWSFEPLYFRRAVQGQAAHTDHPLRHWDRMCPACNASIDYEQAGQAAPEALILTQQEAPDYELHCNDEWVAGASGLGALRGILHYASQYAKDGPLTLYAVTRREVFIDAAMSGAKAGDKGGKVG